MKPDAATLRRRPSLVPPRTKRWRVARLAVVLGLAALQAACIVVPQTREFYDPECRMLKKEMRLETAVVGRFQACQGDGCIALLVATGAVTAASAVVSGSIALVGNVAYWFENQGRCNRPDPQPEAPPPVRLPA